MRMNFTNKAGILFVAAGISCGAQAMNGQDQDGHLQGQWAEQYDQKPCEKKVRPELWKKKRCRDLGSRKTTYREHTHQVTERVTHEVKNRTDTTWQDLARKEIDIPYVKSDPCQQQEQAQRQLEAMVLKDDNSHSQQQQDSCTARKGKVVTDKAVENRQLGEVTETAHEYFDSATQTTVKITNKMWEETWNSYESESEDEGPEQKWDECACDQVQK